MGPTGSGKTLLLESLAGLVRPDSGTVVVDGRSITALPPEKRSMGLVYQDHALFPNLSVFDNIVYGQRYHGIDRHEGKRYAVELMDMLDISALADRYPENLSGGEKQRTALARALACKPAIVLLDEPLSSLDPQFREGLRRNLKRLHEATEAIFFMVTHDFVDALSLADRAAVIREGKIEQIGDTADIFHRPVTTFIADFVGMKNIFPATPDNGLRELTHAAVRHRGVPFDGSGHIALRPEDISLAPDNTHPHTMAGLPGTVRTIVREGFTWLAVVACSGVEIVARIDQRSLLNGVIQEGRTVYVGLDPENMHYIPKLPG